MRQGYGAKGASQNQPNVRCLPSFGKTLGGRSVTPVNGKTATKRPEFGSEAQPPTRLLYPVNEVAGLLGGVTPRYVWSLIEHGRLRTVKIGRRRLIPHDALAQFLASLNVPCPEPSEVDAGQPGAA